MHAGFNNLTKRYERYSDKRKDGRAAPPPSG